MPKKEDIVIPIGSPRYSNFNSKSIFITAVSILSTVKDNKLEKLFDNVINALKQPKNLLCLLRKPKI